MASKLHQCLLLFCLFTALIEGKETFKKCKDVDFCNIYRNKFTPKPVVMDLATLEIKENAVSIKLGDNFLLKLEFYTNCIKLFIDDKEKGRFKVADIIEKLEPVDVVPNFPFHEDFIELKTTKERKVVISLDKSTVEFKKNDELLISWNSKNLFSMEIEDSDATSSDFCFHNFQDIYGIPEHTTPVSLRATKKEGFKFWGNERLYTEPYRLKNLDVFEYDLESPEALYGTVPMLMAKRTGFVAGFLNLNAAETWIDISRLEEEIKSHWMSETGVIESYFILENSVEEFYFNYGKLTGFPFLPPIFSIGYHQCRWNYKSQEEVAEVNEKFDFYDIPMDAIWLDIEHTDGKRYFTWDSRNFPEPEKMLDELKIVTIVDPHIKIDENYSVYVEAKENSYLVRDSNGYDFEGDCWPGKSVWIDFFNPDARKWWQSLFSFEKYKHSRENLYIWNDMNEPSVFSQPEVTMPGTNIHFDGVKNLSVHNLYGMKMHESTFLGLKNRNGKRPFVLSRSFYAGSQKTAAMWTGDNKADWSHLRYSIPMCLSLSLAGIPFIGADVGGFFGNPEPELLLRWYQVGIFYPFFRAHAHIDSKRREPWVFGEPWTSLIREAIVLRYTILPYLYYLFWNSSITGMPIMRPLWMEFEEAAGKIESQFMLGSALMSAPILVSMNDKQTIEHRVYMPGNGVWYSYTEELKAHQGGFVYPMQANLNDIPLFIKGGSILPLSMRLRRSTAKMSNDPITLLVVLDLQESATGGYYNDDGNTFKYEEGNFVSSELDFKDFRLFSTPKTSNYKSTCVERIRIAGLKSKVPKEIQNNSGERLEFIIYENYFDVKLPKVCMSDSWSIQIK